MKKQKSKDQKSKKSKDEKKKKDDDGGKSQKSASKSKGKQKSVTPSKKEKEKEPKAKKLSMKENQSQISSISQSPVAPADCIHHKSPFINFCQTCEELVCNQCTVYGPHNNHLHRILKMTDAYRLRKFYLVQAIRSNLVDKRDKIIAQLHRLEYRIEEIRFVKNIIERDIRSEYSGIFERLKSYEGIKLSNLTHEVSLVQRQIDAINDLGNKFFDLTNMDCQKIEQQRKLNKFLCKSKEMYEQIQYLTTKPDRQLPDIGINEIPRQIELNRELVKKALAGKQINSMKNQIIWKMICDLRNEQNVVKKQVQERASAIIHDHSEEVQRLNEKLSHFRMICCYCGIRMNEQSVNSKCQRNSSKDSLPDKQLQTERTPRQGYSGNNRHYFSKVVIKPQS